MTEFELRKLAARGMACSPCWLPVSGWPLSGSLRHAPRCLAYALRQAAMHLASTIMGLMMTPEVVHGGEAVHAHHAGLQSTSTSQI